MSEEIKSTATDTGTQQDDTVSDVVDVADTNDESTLLSEDSTPKKDTQTEVKDSKSDLLGDVEQKDESAPEEYEPFTLADGTEMDKSDVEVLSAIAKEHGLTQEVAQKAALVANDLVGRMVKEQEEHVAKVVADNEAAWKKQDVSGEKTLLARKAIESLGSEVHGHLKANNYLQDAKIMSILSDYGRMISEGKSISGKPATQQSALYPNTPELYNKP